MFVPYNNLLKKFSYNDLSTTTICFLRQFITTTVCFYQGGRMSKTAGLPVQREAKTQIYKLYLIAICNDVSLAMKINSLVFSLGDWLFVKCELESMILNLVP